MKIIQNEKWIELLEGIRVVKQKKLQEEQMKETTLIESSQMETLVVKKSMLI